MLKEDWEKADELETLEDATIRAMAASSGRSLRSYAVISGGCANLNIKLLFSEGAPLILRVYLRDAEAGAREKALAARLKGLVPVPQVLHLGEHGGRRFALVQYAEGITLRDLLLKNPGTDIAPVMREAGRLLAPLGKVAFNAGGMFDKTLKVAAGAPPDFIEFALTGLAAPGVKQALTEPVTLTLAAALESSRADLPATDAHSLVHGDYDPANILVAQEGGAWKISAVLDWEFAFSGSYLWDVGNMMRDAHRLPPACGEAFLDGVAAGGIQLPGNWRRSICLTNIFSLLYMLQKADPAVRPRARADMVALIRHFAAELSSEKR